MKWWVKWQVKKEERLAKEGINIVFKELMDKEIKIVRLLCSTLETSSRNEENKMVTKLDTRKRTAKLSIERRS